MVFSSTSHELEDNIIEIKNLNKSYGKNPIFNRLSVNFASNENTGLIGPNGAGKTTLFKCILGLTPIQNGTIRIFNDLTCINGKINRRTLYNCRYNIGFVPEETTFYEHLSLREYLQLVATLLELPKEIQKTKIDSLIQLFRLERWSTKMISVLSKGNRQKLNIASAFIQEPQLLILDEPLIGLDPSGRYQLTKLFLKFSSKEKNIINQSKPRTIIISSHLLSDIEKICNKVIVINHVGEIVVSGPISRVKEILSTEASLEDVYLAVVEGISDETVVDTPFNDD